MSQLLGLLNGAIFVLVPTVVSCEGASLAVLLRKHLTPTLLDDALGALDKVLPQPEAKRVRVMENYPDRIMSYSGVSNTGDDRVSSKIQSATVFFLRLRSNAMSALSFAKKQIH